MKELKNTILMIISTIAMFYILGFAWLEIYTPVTVALFALCVVWIALFMMANIPDWSEADALE